MRSLVRHRSRVVSIRHDVWEESPGAWRFLFAVRAGDASACFLVAFDPATLLWTQGRAVFQDWGFEVDRGLLVSAIPMEPAKWWFLAPLGALRRGVDAQLEMIVSALEGVSATEDTWFDRRARAIFMGNATINFEDRPYRLPSVVLGNEEPDARLLHGARNEPLPDGWMGRFSPRRENEGRTDIVEGSVGGAIGYGATSGSVWKLSAATESWCNALSSRTWPAALRFVKPAHWTPEAYAFYMDPALGAYRRQAGDAFPFLAPLFHKDKELRRLIDAGRPYEERLVEILSGWLPEGTGGLTVAKLRRMRGMRREFTPSGLCRFLAFVAPLPVDLVGPIAVAWDSRSGPDMEGLAQWAEKGGLGPADLMGSFAHLDLKDGRRLLAAASDMALNLSMDLVQPVLPEGTDEKLTDRVAARILFGGRSVDAILRLSARWHANLSRFQDAMPAGEDRVSWPALFPDFVHDARPDVVVTCLTKPSELKMEGSYGLDDIAGAGLRNCVAGYGPSCHCGQRHVASLRRRTDAGWERVSTVEFNVHPGAFRTGRQSPPIRVVQHQAVGNTPPPRWAIGVVDALVDAIAAGRHPMDEAAARTREAKGYDDGIDRTDPAVREAILQAWRPYLPRSVAGPGCREFDALVSTIFRESSTKD